MQKQVLVSFFKWISQEVTNVQQVADVQNILSIQQSNGLELPEWSDAVFPEDLLDVRVRSFQLYTEGPYMKRIKGGPLVTDIFDQMYAKQNGELSRKIMIFSAHDKTLANVMSALNVIDQTEPLPDYGATLLFELYCGGSDECTVRVSDALSSSHNIRFHFSDLFVHSFFNQKQISYFFNTDDELPKLLTLPNCPNPCTLSHYEEAINYIRIENFTRDCHINDRSNINVF